MDETALKITLAGLDNAGKTSILLSVARQYDPHKIRPTIGAERSLISVLGFKIYRFDLGGQEKYRATYLDENSKVLSNIDLLLYAVDVQDKTRYQEAISYFDAILKYLEAKGQDPQIVIFLHKSDPNFIKTETGQKCLSELIFLFKDRIHKPLISFFITTIFNRDTLMYAFSQSLLRLFPKPNAINNLLSAFIDQQGLDAAFLYDHNFILVGSALVNETAKSYAILQSIHRIYYLFEALVKANQDGYSISLDFQKKESLFNFKYVFRRVLFSDWEFFIVFVSQEMPALEDIIPELKNQFELIKSKLLIE